MTIEVTPTLIDATVTVTPPVEPVGSVTVTNPSAAAETITVTNPSTQADITVEQAARDAELITIQTPPVASIEVASTPIQASIRVVGGAAPHEVGTQVGQIPFWDGKFWIPSGALWNAALTQFYARRMLTEYIDFVINPEVTPAKGRLCWNDTDGTLDLYMSENGIVVQQIGQELFVKVVNKTAAMIPEGTVLYCNGRQGIRPTVDLACGNSEATSRVLGVATEDIAVNAEGLVTILGYVRKIKTDYDGWQEGHKLWVSKTTPGALTNIEPTVRHHSDIVGSVGIVHQNQGSILVYIQRHKTLEELSDVNGTPLELTGQFPSWNNTNQYFDFSRKILLFALGADTVLKTDADEPRDLLITTGAGKIVLYGTQTTEDLNFDPARSGGPVNTRPDEVVIEGCYYREFTNANNQTCGATQEVPHHGALGVPMGPHAHIFLKAGESAGTTGVQFTIAWSLRQTTGRTSGSAVMSATSAQLASVAGANKLDLYNGSFAGPTELGAQLSLTITRTGGNAGDVIVLTYGVHYKKDSSGSRSETVK